ncbi:hypothetical protein [Altericroceibacterium endophyticum]|uniref:Uncharacterized protein n=1 Tax=Altericroceibacterium endophyticum TaxID=1808508 RepID=A0A6I4T988_9SPHN|nr:hypothetical protein [Altericroceibacterium endophyticum]MXO66959.1 hypothetical protein [Altericroceibacterium endophyticum]
METEDNKVHMETDQARSGSTPHIVRWILVISIVLAAGLLSIIWITGAVDHDESEEEVSATVQNESIAQEDETNGAVAGDAANTGDMVTGDTEALTDNTIGSEGGQSKTEMENDLEVIEN